VEPSAGALANVTLVDIEGLRGTLAVRAAETAADIERAHEIVAEEVERFARRRRTERLAPVIQALRERGDAVVASELERFRSDLATLTPDERAAVEALARGIVAKLLHEPIVRMKDRPDPAEQDRLAALLAELFGVEPPGE
jgi:glutamyl-tRNA reductase